MKRKNKWIALGLATAMVAGSLLTGCGGSGEAAKETGAETQAAAEETQAVETEAEEAVSVEAEVPAIDTSKHVNLVCYFVGDAPQDIQKVQDKINERLEEEINANISFQFTTWTDYKNKYSMILSGGENCDIIFTAPWMLYYSMIEKDAYLDLNELVDEYAPGLRETIGDRYFEETLIDGALYTIPNNYEEYFSGGIIYREDLRAKYDLPVPDSMEDLEAFMAGIAANEPDMQVLYPKCANYLVNLETAYACEQVGMVVPYNDVHDVQHYWGSEDQIADFKKIKEWADAGYWSKDAIAESTSDPLPAFQAGETALIRFGVNYNKYISSLTSMANPDWEIGYVSCADVNGVAFPSAPYHNGIAIPTNSENPERAMMAINLLYTDEELNHLLMYGIEGEHYNIDENGYYVPAENNAAFGYEACSSWNFRNTSLMLYRESEQETMKQFEHEREIAAKTVTPYVNHEEGYSGVLTETTNQKAAIDALVTEYITPLQYGMVDDIEGTVAKFMEAANAAGLEAVQEEFTGLWNEYVESKGY